MLHPKHHLYLHIISAQKSRGLFSGYFLTIYAFQALILLAFWRNFQRVPWQMNNTLIIIFFLLKYLVLPYFTHFFGFLQELQFSGNCSKSGKTRQFETKCSSLQQSIGSRFRVCRLPGFLNLLTIKRARGAFFTIGTSSNHKFLYPLIK